MSSSHIGVPSSEVKSRSLESDRISSCFHELPIGKLVWRNAIV
ncbi:MAG: hypothetical protein V7K41_27625 [Nostoc sp.]